MVLTKDIIIERFASRARAYICTNHHLQKQRSASMPSSTNTKDVPVPVVVKKELVLPSSDDIENVAKAFKSHRCVLDFDSGFVRNELRKGKEEMNNNEME